MDILGLDSSIKSILRKTYEDSHNLYKKLLNYEDGYYDFFNYYMKMAKKRLEEKGYIIKYMQINDDTFSFIFDISKDGKNFKAYANISGKISVESEQII